MHAMMPALRDSGVVGAGVESVAPLAARLEEAGVPFTRSMSGRAAIFFRDPDANVLEVAEVKPWR